MVNSASLEKLRELAVGMVNSNPTLMFELLEPVQPQPGGHHPSPDSPNPDWCCCGHCREMPTPAERLCCQLANCTSQMPVCIFFSQNIYEIHHVKCKHSHTCMVYMIEICLWWRSARKSTPWEYKFKLKFIKVITMLIKVYVQQSELDINVQVYDNKIKTDTYNDT
jgi:hypothetical protein